MELRDTTLDELKMAYSFERPARIIGLGLIKGMMQAGLTEEQALDVCKSKLYRYSLDGDFGDRLEDAAIALGQEWVKSGAVEFLRKECLLYGDPIWTTTEVA